LNHDHMLQDTTVVRTVENLLGLNHDKAHASLYGSNR
jgi:hypothetical protein